MHHIVHTKISNVNDKGSSDEILTHNQSLKLDIFIWKLLLILNTIPKVLSSLAAALGRMADSQSFPLSSVTFKDIV